MVQICEVELQYVRSVFVGLQNFFQPVLHPLISCLIDSLLQVFRDPPQIVSHNFHELRQVLIFSCVVLLQSKPKLEMSRKCSQFLLWVQLANQSHFDSCDKLHVQCERKALRDGGNLVEKRFEQHWVLVANDVTAVVRCRNP